MRTSNPASLLASRRQGGIVATLVAVVVLVATLLAAMALMRSVDTANNVAGSMAFRQSAFQEAERAYTDIRTNLESYFAPPVSDSDAPDKGYYASLQAHTSVVRPEIPDVLLNLTDGKFVALADVPGANTQNHVYYVVERLCPAAGAATPNSCIVPGTAISGGTSSNLTTDPGIPFNTTGSAAAFRLTVRVNGPRNAVAYVQTIIR
jgi:type IV pilus assembly protein PilX